MLDLRMADLVGRVLLSRERVKFADADPYGHLGSGAYVDLMMSHRVEALEDVLGYSIVRHARSGITFPTRSLTVSYQRPALVGETLELASWIVELGPSSFQVRIIVSGAEDRTVRAAAIAHFVTLDPATGKRVPVPETLPSSASTDPIPGLPGWSDYVAGLTGLPEGW